MKMPPEFQKEVEKTILELNELLKNLQAQDIANIEYNISLIETHYKKLHAIDPSLLEIINLGHSIKHLKKSIANGDTPGIKSALLKVQQELMSLKKL